MTGKAMTAMARVSARAFREREEFTKTKKKMAPPGVAAVPSTKPLQSNTPDQFRKSCTWESIQNNHFHYMVLKTIRVKCDRDNLLN
jgi:hypothetical protein